MSIPSRSTPDTKRTRFFFFFTIKKRTKLQPVRNKLEQLVFHKTFEIDWQSNSVTELNCSPNPSTNLREIRIQNGQFSVRFEFRNQITHWHRLICFFFMEYTIQAELAVRIGDRFNVEHEKEHRVEINCSRTLNPPLNNAFWMRESMRDWTRRTP